jgi:hypothetical protein
MTPSINDGFAQFDPLLEAADVIASPWVDGQYVPNLDLLRDLLSLPISQGDKQESGRTAKAFDAWTAHELRRSGFPADAVWPRRRRPRVLAEGLADLEAKLDNLAAQVRAAELDGTRIRPPALRRAIRALDDALPGGPSAYILGDFYAKQIDVGLASWKRGPDILISTKTMFSAYGKNLKNRHEEAIGEVSSLRRRHPMAAMGYAYLVRQDILREPNSYAILYDILTRLRRPGETFDATVLLVIDWDDANLTSGITLDQPADDLTASRFFADLVCTVIDRTPLRVHQEVRKRRGSMPVEGLRDEEEEVDDLE